ncbi:MAG TPA: M48 family metalloprotease [Burkholderiales bacterium]
MRLMRALIWPILASSLLGACSTSPYGRTQLTMPQTVSAVYSEVNMRLKLVTTADAKGNCTESECDASKEFELHVARLGERLAGKAFELYPDLNQRIGRFDFVIAEKAEPGTTSNASGTVVIFSGTRALELSDPALAFILAREMGHVIGSHHNENAATKIIASILAQVLLPISGIFRAFALVPGASSAAAASATTATASAGSAAALTATATAASFLGSQVVIASYWPQQLGEADTIALTLLARLGYDPQETADALAVAERRLDDSSWPRDLLASSRHVARIAQGPRPDKERLAQLAGSAPLKLTYVIGNPSADATELSPQTRAQ